MKFIPLFLLLASCGTFVEDVFEKDEPSRHVNQTDQTFYEYLEELQINVRTPIIFSDQQAPTVGSCNIWTDGYREIQIDKGYWDSATDSQRKTLLLHEIGHCDHGLKHIEGTREDSCPYSVMQMVTFGDPCFDVHYYDYVEEIRLLYEI